MSWRGLVTNNLAWKLTAVFLAILVWFTLRRDGEGQFELAPAFGVSLSTREFVAHPVHALVRQGQPALFKLDPARVDITVSGDRAMLGELTGNEIKAFVEVAGMGDTNMATKRVQVYAPSAVTVHRVAPSIVRIERLRLEAESP